MLFIPLPPIAGVNRRSIVKFFVELAPWGIPLTRGVSKLHSQEKTDAKLCESVGTEPGSFRTSAFTPRPDSALAISVAFRKRERRQKMIGLPRTAMNEFRRWNPYRIKFLKWR